VSLEPLVPAMGGPWTQRRSQLTTIVGQELARGLSLRRGLWLLLLGFAPVFIIFMHAIHDGSHGLAEETLILGVILQLYYVRCGIFFGCLGLAMRLVRGEVAERTLHYPLLAPVRREVLMVGKFLAAALTAILVFGSAVTTAFLLMYLHFDGGTAFLRHGGGLGHLGWYLLVTVLASVGYLAVLLALSLVFRNPVVPAALFIVWEGINAFLPVSLKYFSVTFYLKPLFPVQLPLRGLDLLTVVAEPTPVWLAVAGLLAFAAAVLALACWRIRTLEISYSTD
jgi:ABC-type transport system involved in multi-copper enzyme maturation permease subunit